MNPFSPLYFIRQNKLKCILLMFMLFLGYGAYLGGLYVSEPINTFALTCEYHERCAVFSVRSYNNDTVEQIKNDVSQYENVRLLQLGEYQSFSWKSIMGFTLSNSAFSFHSPDDLKAYCSFMGIEYNFGELKSGDMVMSDMFAKNRGLKIGDTVDNSFNQSITSEFTLRATTDEDGYVQYFITDENALSPNFMLIGENGKSSEELFDIAHKLRDKYDIEVLDSLRESAEESFKTFNTIYIFIIILLSVILAVTINAAFVGMYQHRNFEFAVYRAIGFTRRQMIGKLVGELLCIDLIALAAGGAVFFLWLYLFNNLSLYPMGLRLNYYQPLALQGLLVCDLTVVIPLMITRCRQLLKADICEY